MADEQNSVEDILQKLDDQVAQAARHADEMKSLSDRISSVTAETASSRDEVRVRVDSGGRVIGLTLHESAMRLDAERLAALVMATIDDGYRQVSAQTVALAAETLGEDSPTVAHLKDSARLYAPQYDRDEGEER